jgi:hypothetical protein
VLLKALIGVDGGCGGNTGGNFLFPLLTSSKIALTSSPLGGIHAARRKANFYSSEKQIPIPEKQFLSLQIPG